VELAQIVQVVLEETVTNIILFREYHFAQRKRELSRKPRPVSMISGHDYLKKFARPSHRGSHSVFQFQGRVFSIPGFLSKFSLALLWQGHYPTTAYLASTSIRANSDSVSNEIDEIELEFEKHDKQRIRT
jgi:hypothetical protein